MNALTSCTHRSFKPYFLNFSVQQYRQEAHSDPVCWTPPAELVQFSRSGWCPKLWISNKFPGHAAKEVTGPCRALSLHLNLFDECIS